MHQFRNSTVSTLNIYADLVEDAAIIRIQAALIKEQTLLYCITFSAPDHILPSMATLFLSIPHVHLLNPLTGVDISARSVSWSGNAGNATANRSRRAAAEAKRAVFGCSL
jgi:hypothetical protein